MSSSSSRVRSGIAGRRRPIRAEGWPARVPVGDALISVRDAQDRRLVERPSDDLEADRQPGRGEPARHRQPRYPCQIDWNSVNPKEILGSNFSSAQGYKTINKELQEASLIPQVGGGGGCGV